MEEKIDVADFTFESNDVALQLIEQDPGGILMLLDQESHRPDGTHDSFRRNVLRLANTAPDASVIVRTSVLARGDLMECVTAGV